MATFGERCKELRSSKYLSQEEFANIIGVNKGTVSKWETNARLAELNTMKQIAEFFDVDLSYLMGGTDEKRRSVSGEEILPEWAIEDEDEELFDDLKYYCMLSKESRVVVSKTIRAFYLQDKKEKKLLPEDQYELSVKTVEKYR